MNNPLNYRFDQARRAEEMRKAEQMRLTQQAKRETFYSQTLAQFGRKLVTLGQRLLEKAGPQPEPGRAYR